MATSPISPLAGQTAATTAAATDGSRARLNQTFDSFLTLLTTQLRYQDPISPMDTNEFTNQLVQFSQVEQTIRSNDRLDTLIGLQGANQIAFAASLAGRLVEIEGNAGSFDGSTPVGWGYELPAGTVASTVTVMDGAGRTIATAAGAGAAGDHAFTWDGTTASGATAAPGTYRLQVTARDAAGKETQAETTVEVTVTGVALEDGEIRLEIGAMSVPLTAVRAIRTGSDA
jgi:flagellar basal-body rod modification protein FlgD